MRVLPSMDQKAVLAFVYWDPTTPSSRTGLRLRFPSGPCPPKGEKQKLTSLMMCESYSTWHCLEFRDIRTILLCLVKENEFWVVEGAHAGVLTTGTCLLRWSRAPWQPVPPARWVSVWLDMRFSERRFCLSGSAVQATFCLSTVHQNELLYTKSKWHYNVPIKF